MRYEYCSSHDNRRAQNHSELTHHTNDITLQHYNGFGLVQSTAPTFMMWLLAGFYLLGGGGRSPKHSSFPQKVSANIWIKFSQITLLVWIKFCIIDGRGLVGPTISLHHAMGIRICRLHKIAWYLAARTKSRTSYNGSFLAGATLQCMVY